MAVTLITSDKAAGSTGATTPAMNMSTATFLAALIHSSNGGSGLPSDSASGPSNTWASRTRKAAAFGGSQLFDVAAPHVLASQTFTTNGSSAGIVAAGFAGVHATPFDVESGAIANASTTVQPGSVTPAASGSLLLLGWSTDTAAITISGISGGFTILQQTAFSPGNFYGGGLAYLIQGAAAAINPTITASGSTDLSCVMAVYKPAAGATIALRMIALLNGLGGVGPFFSNPLG